MLNTQPPHLRSQIIFDWAPTCAGPLGVGAVVANAMREEEAKQKQRTQVRAISCLLRCYFFALLALVCYF